MIEPAERTTEPGRSPAASSEGRFPPLDGPAPDLPQAVVSEGRGPLLVLNGDTFDFVRIDVSPREDDDFRAWSSSLDGLGVTRSPEELRAEGR